MTRAARQPSQYAPTLLLFFEEEIMGEALFAELSGQAATADQRQKMMLLSKMERVVAENVRPLLGRHGLQPRSDAELHRIGREGATRYHAMPWLGFMQRIITEFPVFLDEFAALGRLAPGPDLALLVAFASHEVAAIDFARREISGDPDSSVPLQEFLASHTQLEAQASA